MLKLFCLFIYSASLIDPDNDRENTRNLCPNYCIALRGQVNKYVNNI